MNKNTLITAAGVIVFLAAGMFTMLFFPERQAREQNQAKINEKPNVAVKTENAVTLTATDETESKIKNETSTPKPDWWVYVTGEVKKPGYYQLSADSRIFQAIEIAGGFTEKADQASVNMAAVLVDGFQINVAAKGAKKSSNSNPSVPVPGMQAKPVIIYQNAQPENKKINIDGKVDINLASEKELEKLNGVGPATAKKIIEYRNSKGKFSKPEDLLNVKGIGKVKLEKMKSQILIR